MMRKTVKARAKLDNVDAQVTRKSVAPPAQPKPVPKAVPTSAPPYIESMKGHEMVVREISKSTTDTMLVLAALTEEVKKIKVEAVQPVTEWVFDFHRDDRGFLTKVTAHGSSTN